MPAREGRRGPGAWEGQTQEIQDRGTSPRAQGWGGLQKGGGGGGWGQSQSQRGWRPSELGSSSPNPRDPSPSICQFGWSPGCRPGWGPRGHVSACACCPDGLGGISGTRPTNPSVSGSTELGRMSVAFPLRETASQLGPEMSRSWWRRGGGQEVPPETLLLSLRQPAWGPGRAGWCPESGRRLQAGATGVAGAASLAPPLGFLVENRVSPCPPQGRRELGCRYELLKVLGFPISSEVINVLVLVCN